MYPPSFRRTLDRGPGQGPESSIAARIAEEDKHRVKDKGYLLSKQSHSTAEIAEIAEKTNNRVKDKTIIHRPFVALEPVSNVKDNVAGKLRRYTSTTLHEYNVVLAGYVGSVVVPHVLVSAFPIQSFSRFFTGSCDPLPITHHPSQLYDSRLPTVFSPITRYASLVTVFQPWTLDVGLWTASILLITV